MIILGIETSCDDTGIAVIKAIPARPAGFSRRGGTQIPKFKILSNVVSSQIELHKKYGGVFPSLAKREHQKNLVPVLEQALKEAKLLKNRKQKTENRKQVISRSRDYLTTLNSILERETELLKNLLSFLKKYEKPKFDPYTKFGVGVDLITVTNGPGLEPCLWVGINFAKALALVWDLPIIPVNHIEAHILVNLLDQKIKFPALSLIVSGGHTQLVLMQDFGKYKIIGETRDDAAGECFDKTARILGLGYPGGPAISAAAEKLPTTHYPLQTKFPRPMIHQKNYDFSFSGLKTAVLYEYKKQPKKIQKSKKYISEIAQEIQQAIIDVLIKKTVKAAKDFKAKSIILSGGVAANDELRKQLLSNVKCLPRRSEATLRGKMSNVKFLVPPKIFCTDNGVMTAVTGYFHKPKKLENIEAEANLRI